MFFNCLKMTGENLKKLLKERDLTQEQAAKLFDVTRSAITKWVKMEKISEKTEALIYSKLNSLIKTDDELPDGVLWEHLRNLPVTPEMLNYKEEIRRGGKYLFPSKDYIINYLLGELDIKDRQILLLINQMREQDKRLSELLDIIKKWEKPQ